jgi:uncharacterized protein YdeI (BOF family)
LRGRSDACFLFAIIVTMAGAHHDTNCSTDIGYQQKVARARGRSVSDATTVEKASRLAREGAVSHRGNHY